MAEEKDQVDGGSQAADAGTQQQDYRFTVQKIYIKDSSFESPGSPDCFQQPYNPKVDFSINNSSRQMDKDKGLVEANLRLTADIKNQEDKTLALVEVQQGGIFQIQGFEGEQLEQILNISCPSLLFPYAREAIDALMTKGGFPALMLAPVNFEALYRQAKEQHSQQQAEENNTQ